MPSFSSLLLKGLCVVVTIWAILAMGDLGRGYDKYPKPKPDKIIKLEVEHPAIAQGVPVQEVKIIANSSSNPAHLLVETEDNMRFWLDRGWLGSPGNRIMIPIADVQRRIIETYGLTNK